MAVTKKEATEPEVLNLDVKVAVRNIADWDANFARVVDGIGDVRIVPNGTVMLSRNEIIAQVQTGNTLLAGIDGMGSHANLYIEDAATRKELGFETDTKKQNILTDEKVKKLFGIANQRQFEEEFKKEIVTRAEAKALLNAVKRLNINDYNKIRFAEKTTGFSYE